MPIHAISRFELRPPLTVLAVMISMGLLIGCSANSSPVSTTPPPPIAKTFHNPVQALVAGGGVVEDCPDPSIITWPDCGRQLLVRVLHHGAAERRGQGQ